MQRSWTSIPPWSAPVCTTPHSVHGNWWERESRATKREDRTASPHRGRDDDAAEKDEDEDEDEEEGDDAIAEDGEDEDATDIIVDKPNCSNMCSASNCSATGRRLNNVRLVNSGTVSMVVTGEVAIRSGTDARAVDDARPNCVDPGRGRVAILVGKTGLLMLGNKLTARPSLGSDLTTNF